VWGYGLPGERAAARRPAWRSLRARLAVAVFCTAAAGSGVITAAGHLVAQDYLTQQADQQLRSYVRLLTGRPFTVFPGSPVAPGASGPGGPGRAVSIEVRDSAGQPLISAGTVIPPAGRGSWLKITEPVRYQARHIPFAYGAEDTSFSVTARTGTGLPGTLVVGLDLASVGQAVHRLMITCLAVGGVVLLLVTFAAAGLAGILLLPLDRMAETAAGAAAGDLCRRMPAGKARGDIGRLARSLNRALSQAEQARNAAAASAADARESGERTCRAAADLSRELRRPLMVVAGLAGAYRERDGPGAGDLDRAMARVADEAARIDAVLDNLPRRPASADTRRRLGRAE
jgi:two-component system OmpR family sensor kinase